MLVALASWLGLAELDQILDVVGILVVSLSFTLHVS